MKTKFVQRVLLAAALMVVGPMLRAEPSTSPASQSVVMSAEITGVEGMVQVRETPDKPWQKATVGMVVNVGAEFRTGPRSSVRCQVGPDQVITLDRLGTMSLLTALQDGNVLKTKVGMPYGRTRYDIEAAGLEHQAELVSPSSTLAIRGTKVSIYDQPPFAPAAVSLTGRAIYSSAKRQIAFGGKGAGRTDVNANTDNVAAGALLKTFVDPNSSFGRPGADQALINNLQAKGDIVLNNGTLALAFGSAVTDAQLGGIIASQGRFNVSLRWTGPGDFDLFVLGTDAKTGNPYTLGNPSYKGSVFKDVGLFDAAGSPITAAQSPDGGRIKFDQIAFGGGGLELASWNTPVPQQGYTVAVVYYDQSGRIKNYPVRSDFRVDAFLDGKSLPVLTNFSDLVHGTATSLEFGPIYTGTASLIDSEKTLVTDKVKGDILITAVDLSPEATGLDGKPIGNINPTNVSQSLKKKIDTKTVAPLTIKTPPPANIATVAAPKKK